MKEKYIKLGLYFQVPPKVFNEAISISKQLGSKYKTKAILDGKNFYPHITIYSPEYPVKNLQKILKSIKKTVKEFNTIKMVFSGVQSKDEYVGIYFNLSSEIENLYKRMLVILNSLRDGHIMDKYSSPDHKKKYNSKELENIKTYGYPYIIDSDFRPHLSLIRLENKKDANKVKNEVKWDIEKFYINKLVLYRVSKNGSPVELIKEFNLPD